jgi:GMP synthase-like glutamine amidotransferase
VERGRLPEIGGYDVTTDRPDVIASGPWLQWHYDVVTVPPGAEELARSAVGPQAWRLGRSLAVQFHPEATESMLARWTSGGDELERFGITVFVMLEDFLQFFLILNLNCHLILLESQRSVLYF